MYIFLILFLLNPFHAFAEENKDFLSPQVLCESPYIIFVEGFLNDKECDHLIKKALPNLKRSEVVDPLAQGNMTHAARTSEGVFLAKDPKDKILACIEKKIASFTHLPEKNGEDLHILHYGVGGEYQPHYDYFDPHTRGGAFCLQRGGQRIATFIMYLNDTEEGGETIFPKLHVRIKPKKGCALLFYNCSSDGKENPKTLHGGRPVIKGEKWIATKWIRENEFK